MSAKTAEAVLKGDSIRGLGLVTSVAHYPDEGKVAVFIENGSWAVYRKDKTVEVAGD